MCTDKIFLNRLQSWLLPILSPGAIIICVHHSQFSRVDIALNIDCKAHRWNSVLHRFTVCLAFVLFVCLKLIIASKWHKNYIQSCIEPNSEFPLVSDIMYMCAYFYILIHFKPRVYCSLYNDLLIKFVAFKISIHSGIIITWNNHCIKSRKDRLPLDAVHLHVSQLPTETERFPSNNFLQWNHCAKIIA